MHRIARPSRLRAAVVCLAFITLTAHCCPCPPPLCSPTFIAHHITSIYQSSCLFCNDAALRRLAFLFSFVLLSIAMFPPAIPRPPHDALPATHQLLYLYALSRIASHPEFRTNCSHHHRITSTTYPTHICVGGHPFPACACVPVSSAANLRLGPGLHLRGLTPGRAPAGHPVASAGVGRGPPPPAA